MAFISCPASDLDIAALDLPRLGVEPRYLDQMLAIHPWAVDQGKHALMTEFAIASDMRDQMYLHLLIVEGKPLFFELFAGIGEQVGGRFFYKVRVRNPAVLAGFPPGYLEGLASEGMAVLDLKGGGVTFELAP